MVLEQKAELKAWLAAVIFHGVIFVALSLSGLFMLVQPQPESEPVEVELTEAPAPDGGMAGGSAAEATAAAPMEVSLSAQKLPPIQESYTQEPQKQQEYRQQHKAAEISGQERAAASGTAAVSGAADKGSATGTGTAAQGSGGSSAGTGSSAEQGNGSAAAGQAQTERVAAHCTYRPAPLYPESLRQQGVEGSVRVLILVGEDDTIESVTVVNSSGYPAMDAAAVQAAGGCRFQMNGRRGRYTTTYSFQLTDGDDW